MRIFIMFNLSEEDKKYMDIASKYVDFPENDLKKALLSGFKYTGIRMGQEATGGNALNGDEKVMIKYIAPRLPKILQMCFNPDDENVNTEMMDFLTELEDLFPSLDTAEPTTQHKRTLH